ncbi:hypothetical protein [Streptomyces venezuelae]|uniref:hypothetical protein n=1 Tax=Streptomyces venezuelae TaxID=54571 RepID=UPI001CC24C9D|nr:hypothetical protein [Streptomyces venezuelae]
MPTARRPHERAPCGSWASPPTCRCAWSPYARLPLDRIGRLICPARPVKAAPLAGVGVPLAPTVDRSAFPAGVRAGIGAAGSPDRSWREARTALRFATSGRPCPMTNWGR